MECIDLPRLQTYLHVMKMVVHTDLYLVNVKLMNGLEGKNESNVRSKHLMSQRWTGRISPVLRASG